MRFLCLSLFILFLLPACVDDVKPDENQLKDEEMYIDDEPESQRLIWQQPGAVIDAMGDIEEKVIADIGAGEGFFTKRLVPYVDRVIAVDVRPEAIAYLDTLRQFELPKELQSRLEPRLGKYDDPLLEKSEVDMILLVNTFMYIDNQIAYLKKLYPALRSDGRIIIVDYKRKDTRVGPPKKERLAMGALQDMLKKAGFHLVSSDDRTLDYQYIVVADKKKPS
jgi:SAM-dependent methyltransferase